MATYAAVTGGSLSKKPLVAVLGYTGGVGGCLLQAMKNANIEPFALVRSKTMKFCGGATDDVPVNYAELSSRLLEAASKNGGSGDNCVPIIADVTASSEVQEYYKDWLSQGISVVAANKGIFSGSETNYQELLDIIVAKQQSSSSSSLSSSYPRLYHETTVGAGLPILSTINGLQLSSHKIIQIEGILSGTLAYVLNSVAGGKNPLSVAVKTAKELGYTEPDPRDDLNGMDVARKAVILARMCGMKNIELDTMDIESLVPETLKDCSVDEFLIGLSKYDDDFASRVAKVENEQKRLHYAAKVDLANQTVTVKPLPVDLSHPFNHAGPDNIIAITTNYYQQRPLVIQGAGAGGDVTATGVLADIMQCCI